MNKPRGNRYVADATVSENRNKRTVFINKKQPFNRAGDGRIYSFIFPGIPPGYSLFPAIVEMEQFSNISNGELCRLSGHNIVLVLRTFGPICQ